MVVSAVLLFADVEWDGHMDADGAWWVAMAIGMVLFWALVILGIVWLVRELANSRQARQSTGEGDPVAILERRLALGELSPDEYHERRAVLRGESGPSSDTG
ncbi:MAG: SHOCT domain-containing protein [Solirubrobacterales bacterium]